MYTIRITDGTSAKTVINALDRAVAKSRFVATFERAPAGRHVDIWIKPVRLRESKLYCGQHPGECAVGPKRRARFLEWDDWVEFHRLVNDVLDNLGVGADAWTNPTEAIDQGRKMWVRRGHTRRYRWEWTEQQRFGRPLRIWNHGTEDQFTPQYD